MDFKILSDAVNKQFSMMAKHNLFRAGVTKDELWDNYLESFPEGSNPIYKERTEHDCQCCRQFIRAAGNAVAIIDNQMISIWDVEVGGYYQVVADHMSAMVRNCIVVDTFLHYERHIGVKSNHQETEDGDIIMWNHFHYNLPTSYVKSKDDIGTILSDVRSGFQAFNRSLDEITIDALDTVLELIAQKSIYRGEEHERAVKAFRKYKKSYEEVIECERMEWCWVVSAEAGSMNRFRNSAIGTLIVDISNGVELDSAVKMFESKVAPHNYKRPKALITQKMIKEAEDDFIKLGYEGAELRRYAVEEDLTINNVLFANRDSKKKMKSVFDEMAEDVIVNPRDLKKVEEVGIKTFINDILPKCTAVEMMMENRLENNLVSLIAPQISDSKNMLKWGNNFSWAYNGEVADSMRERVKSAGGKVDGVLRFSLQWNDENDNGSDLDAHCHEPRGNHICFRNQLNRTTGGNLDVDNIDPRGKVAVENITWPSLDRMQEGEYKFSVHQYSPRNNNSGFTAEIEYDGEIYSYAYNKPVRHGEYIKVAHVKFSKKDGLTFISSLPSSQVTREVWGLSTNSFQPVKMVMHSPNHWDGEETGNKHYFFMMRDCINDLPARGFFNEFLDERLTKHRKVFEVMGSKMKTPVTNSQLSGLGFSSTQRNSVFCKVVGSFTRTLNVKF